MLRSRACKVGGFLPAAVVGTTPDLTASDAWTSADAGRQSRIAVEITFNMP